MKGREKGTENETKDAHLKVPDLGMSFEPPQVMELRASPGHSHELLIFEARNGQFREHVRLLGQHVCDASHADLGQRVGGHVIKEGARVRPRDLEFGERCEIDNAGVIQDDVAFPSQGEIPVRASEGWLVAGLFGRAGEPVRLIPALGEN